MNAWMSSLCLRIFFILWTFAGAIDIFEVGRIPDQSVYECSTQIECPEDKYGFGPEVRVQCYHDPSKILPNPCLRIVPKTLVNYKLIDTTYFIYIILKNENIFSKSEILFEQDPTDFRLGLPTGIAFDGVLIFSSASDLSVINDDLTESHDIDMCGGTYSTEFDLYIYKVFPSCILDVSDLDDRRRTYVNDVHELLEYFQKFAAVFAVGYSLDGYPINTPYTERGLLQSDLDNCNGKLVDGKYHYFLTPWFPYIIGCYGPGVYHLDDIEDSLGSTYRGSSSVCARGSYYSESTNGCINCPAGTFSTSPYTKGKPCAGICPRGHYCPQGSIKPIPCPAGHYGDQLGLESIFCSGVCTSGFFCPTGSTSSTSQICGNESYFCRSGSAFPSIVLPSYYTIPEGDPLRTDQLLCEPGYYCMNGIRYRCPRGVYGETFGLTDPNCTARCPYGYYCPEGSIIPTICPAGRYGSDIGLTNSSCSGPCSPGFWCPLASSSPQERKCRGGIYGSEYGLMTSHCSSNCENEIVIRDGGTERLPARLHVGKDYLTSAGISEDILSAPFCSPNYCREGYFCPEASSSPTQVMCGGPDQFCPTGSAFPTPVNRGYYTVGKISPPGKLQSELDKNTRTWQLPCEKGFYCVDGVMIQCPPGLYGNVEGAYMSNCSGPCEPGFYCSAGSASPRQNPCGNSSVYCPVGSPLPILVPPGFYSVNGTDSTRSAIVKCPPGSYCVNGIKRLCRAGYYSAKGSSTEECDGKCKAGYYCFEGSSSRTQHSCPAGRYGIAGMKDENCLGICSRGYYCPSNSTSSTQYECGGEYVYCPVGSGIPLNVNIGYYSSGGTVMTRFAQERCDVMSKVTGTPPSAGTRTNICPSTTRWH